jgi:cardiolipin synthase (CMP-forming)
MLGNLQKRLNIKRRLRIPLCESTTHPHALWMRFANARRDPGPIGFLPARVDLVETGPYNRMVPTHAAGGCTRFETPWMNLPNLITVFRIFLIPVLVILLLYDFPLWALVVFSVAALTDSLDGLIARISNQQTTLGTYLDPIADKLLLLSGFITLSYLTVIPLWSAIILVSRDIILIFGTVLLYMVQGRIEITPSWLGKCTTAAQLAYVLVVLAFLTMGKEDPAMIPFLYMTIVLTVVSGLHYIFRAIRFQGRADPA